MLMRLFMLFLLAAASARAATYEVGTNKPYASIGAVPWASLAAGDTVLIHWRTNAYREKWVICRQGSNGAPITVRGVPAADGTLPVIDGRDAATPAPLDFWNEARGVIKIGGADTPPDTTPEHIVIEDLDIRSGRPPYLFTNDAGGVEMYTSNAAAIYIEKGREITIRHCVLRDCGNGLFAGTSGGLSTNLLIEHCTIYDNGISNRIYEHNNYTEVSGITFQHNFFGPLRQGCSGNNLKDRSAGTVIRYNTIVNGNRQLDLVDSETLWALPLYSNTWVYGNLLIEATNDGNSQITHYGGDSGRVNEYRKGMLHFFNNTVASKRTGNTTLFRLSSSNEHADCFNNILFVTETGSRLAMLGTDGHLSLHHNWTKPGWVNSHDTFIGTISNLGGNITGNDPGFVSLAADDYHLTNAAACVDAGTNEAAALVDDLNGAARPLDGDTNGAVVLDIGAYEYIHPEADSDGDRQKDWEELIAGTSPTNPAAFFAFSSQALSAGVSLAWPGVTGRTYDIEYTAALDSPAWLSLSTNIAGTGGVSVVTDTNGAPRRAYRVIVRRP